ncbi:hypothetical protein FKR81_13845 [Lentzea tibetensis]|uniref:Uncharacterized protein n=1 Tax=Lentzea tibetensis TaxID=2591470 RepID=A0A563EW26_9PSEU|nr:hypothetical protein [Lentzea tibetensis]TWP51917.1 hypothetical protein FKR81_13845 [Lentzea tibetensis]
MNVLTPAVEDLYEVFAAPRPAEVACCDHCVDPAKLEPFTSVPLRSLTAEQVGVFWLKSGTIGDEGFVRYLLPRFLELISTGEIDDFDSDYYLRLVTTGYPAWTTREQAAVVRYLRALWTAGLAGHVRIDVGHLLARLADTHDEVGGFLVELEGAPALLADYVRGLAVDEKRPGYVEQWLFGDGPLVALEKAALELPDPDGTYSYTHLMLEGLRVR